jgi:hypothetical protein
MFHAARPAILAKSLVFGCFVTCSLLIALASEPPADSPTAAGPTVPEPIGFADFAKEFLPKAAASEAPVGSPFEKESRVLNRVLAAWRARQERIHSFFIAWDFRSVPRDDVNGGPPDIHTELWMDRDFRCRVLTSSPPNGKPIQHTFDGMTTRTWNPATLHGGVWNGEPDKGLDRLSTTMWRLAIEPFSCGLIDPLSPQLRVVRENALIGNRHCVKLRCPVERRKERDAMFDFFWVDTARDNVIVGWERMTDEAMSPLVSIDYARNNESGWLPTRWIRTLSSATRDSSAVATKITINERFPIDTFRLTFPPGTKVNDRKHSERYVIASDGSKTNVEKYYPLELATIYDSLAEKTDFVVDPEPLKDALEFIAQRYHIKVAIDAQAVRRGLVDPLTEVQTKNAESN